MFDDLILEPKDKLIFIKNQFNLKQKDFTGESMNNSTVSNIFTGKKDLDFNTAKNICHNLYINKNIYIDPLDVIQTIKEQVKLKIIKTEKQLDIYNLKHIDAEFYTILSNIEILFYEYDDFINLDVKLRIYEKVKEKFFNNINWENGLQYIKKSIYVTTAHLNHEKTLELILEAARCAFKVNDEKVYLEIITLITFAIEIMRTQNIENKDILKKISLNRAFALRKIKKYDECIESIISLEKTYYLDDNEKAKANILIGNCKFEKKDYVAAEKLYLKNLKYSKENISKENLALTYINLAEVYINLRNVSKGYEYINKSKENTPIENKEHICKNTYYSVLIYILMKDTKNMLNTSLELLELIKFSNDKNIEKNFINKVMEYLFKNSCDNEIDIFLLRIEEYIYSDEYLNEDIHDIFFDASYYYREKDISKSNEYYYKKNKIKMYISN
jgi:hypothetical protein